MNRPPYFAFYPGDFASDINVEAMSTLQVGAYLLLLCKAWQAEPPASLPNDDQILSRLARLDPATWAEVKAGVLVPWRLGTDGRLHNKRLRLEYDKALSLIRAKTAGGRAGAVKRWATGNTDSSPNGTPNGSASGSPNGTPNANQNQIKSQKGEEKDPPNPPRTGGTPATIPPELDTEQFRRAWGEWKAERAAKKCRPLTPTGEARQLKHLATFGPAVAVEAIETSLRNQWQGLFPEKVQPRSPGGMTRGEQMDLYAFGMIQDALEGDD